MAGEITGLFVLAPETPIAVCGKCSRQLYQHNNTCWGAGTEKDGCPLLNPDWPRRLHRMITDAMDGAAKPRIRVKMGRAS